MAEIEIEQLLGALKAVHQHHIKNMQVRYDEEADIMYVNFGPPRPADDSTMGENDIVYRYHQGELIGITAMHFSTRQ